MRAYCSAPSPSARRATFALAASLACVPGIGIAQSGQSWLIAPPAFVALGLAVALAVAFWRLVAVRRALDRMRGEHEALRQAAGDLDDLRRTRRLIEASRREKQLVLDSIADHVVYQDRDMKIAWCNRAAAASVGKHPSELVGARCWEVWHRGNSPCRGCPVERALASGRNEEAEMTTPDGAVWQVRGYPARDEEGRVEGVVEISREITHRVMAVRALRESEERFQTFMLAIREIVWSAQADTGELLFMNPAGERVYGRPVSDFMANPDLWREVVAPEYRHVLDEKQRQIETSGQADVEYPIVRPDGEIRWLHDRTTLFEASGTQARRLGGIAMDVTDRRRAEEEKRLRQSQLLQADRMISLGILVSGVAHEINNPNHFIMSNAAQVEKVWRSIEPVLESYYREHGDFKMGGRKYSVGRERVPEMISSIGEGARRIRNIVDELRDYAREQKEVLLEPVHPNDVLKSALALLDGLLKKSTSHLEISMGENLPRVPANYQRLEQVLINLVQNACQALRSPDEAIRVATWHDPAADRVVFEVRDEGCGIPEENLAHITDPFFTTKRDLAGIGLGLSISSSIMLEHGGALEFESEPGRGTVARAVLPAESNTEENA